MAVDRALSAAGRKGRKRSPWNSYPIVHKHANYQRMVKWGGLKKKVSADE